MMSPAYEESLQTQPTSKSGSRSHTLHFTLEGFQDSCQQCEPRRSGKHGPAKELLKSQGHGFSEETSKAKVTIAKNKNPFEAMSVQLACSLLAYSLAHSLSSPHPRRGTQHLKCVR